MRNGGSGACATKILCASSPAVATSYAYVNPIVAVLLGATLADKSLISGGHVPIGAILGSVVLLTRAQG